jgi:hypothetical protein
MKWLEFLWPSRSAKPVPQGPLVLEADGRLAVRKKQRLIEGYIWADEMLVARGCTVRDLSPVGASIDLWQDTGSSILRTIEVPQNATLLIVADRVEVDCEVTWRRGPTCLGVRFVGRMRPTTRSFDTVMR